MIASGSCVEKTHHTAVVQIGGVDRLNKFRGDLDRLSSVLSSFSALLSGLDRGPCMEKNLMTVNDTILVPNTNNQNASRDLPKHETIEVPHFLQHEPQSSSEDEYEDSSVKPTEEIHGRNPLETPFKAEEVTQLQSEARELGRNHK